MTTSMLVLFFVLLPPGPEALTPELLSFTREVGSALAKQR